MTTSRYYNLYSVSATAISYKIAMGYKSGSSL